MNQMPNYAKREVESCLRDLANHDLQERTWVHGQVGGPASASELVSQLFDDTALDQYLSQSSGQPIFSNEIDALLIALSERIDKVDLDVSATSLLASAEWQKVQQEAAEAVDLLADLHRGGLP